MLIDNRSSGFCCRGRQPHAQGQYIDLPAQFLVFNNRHEILGGNHPSCFVQHPHQPFVKCHPARIMRQHDRLEGQQCLFVFDRLFDHFQGRLIPPVDGMIQRADLVGVLVRLLAFVLLVHGPRLFCCPLLTEIIGSKR